eukprot:1312649-Pyramimonas_sp.AAC.1
MERGIVHSTQRCDTRDLTADGHAKGGIDREMLEVMRGLKESYSPSVWPDISFCGRLWSICMYRILQARQLARGSTFLIAPQFCCPFVDSLCCICCIEAAGSRLVSLPPRLE